MQDSSHELNNQPLSGQRVLFAIFGTAFVLVSFLLFLALSQAEELGDKPVVWVADKTSINRIDATTNTITQTLPVEDKPTALVIDAKDKVLWVLLKKKLLKFDAASSLVLEVNLKDLVKEFEKPNGLLINPYDQSLWIRSEKSLLHIDNTGKLLHSWKSKDNIQQFKLAQDQTIWLLTKKNLLQLSKEAVLQQRVDLKKLNKEARDLAIDSLGNMVWLASKKQLVRLDSNDLSKAPTIVYAAKDDDATNSAIPLSGGKIHHVALDKQTGVLWLGSKKHISSIDRAGQMQSNTALKKDIEKLTTLVFEPISKSVWLGSENAVLRFSASGVLVKQFAVEDELQALGVTPFRLIPTVEFVAPGEGAITNNPLTPIQFKLGSQCNGTSCDIGDAHFAKISLEVSLNGKDISKDFKITGDTATYQPTTNLPEGLITLLAKATDRFGQDSDTVTGKFTVDTIPPAFTTVSPVDGTSVVTSSIIISGTIDDASATVIVEDLLALGGKILSADPSNFRFQMPLKMGLNTFKLIARDAAGNVATRVLNITRLPQLVLNPIGNKTAPIGQTLKLTITATAPGTANLKFSVLPLPLPTNASFDAGTQVFTFKPDSDQAGSFSLTFSVTDGVLTRNETMTITVPAVDANAPTSLKGRLLDANASSQEQTLPIVGAKVSILGSSATGTTDAQGYFIIQGVPSGLQVLDIDTQGANPAPGGAGYAGFREKFTVLANVNNVIERPLYLPRIETASLTTINPNSTTVVTNARLGITLTVPANTAKNSDGSNFTGQLSISEVPRNLAPAPLPEGIDPGLLVTIQPVGVRFTTPVPITFPNTDNLAAGSEVNIWSLDPDLGIFTIVGVGKVTADGKSVETISGGVRAADWHAILPPSGSAEKVDESVGDKTGCSDTVPASSQADSRTGCLSTSFSLPGYLSLGEARGLTFVYRTERAYPYPVIPFDFTIPVRSAVPPLVSSQLSLGGATQGQETFVSTAGLSENKDETIRAAASVNASSLQTGSYLYRAKLTNHFASSRVSTFIGGNAIVVNGQKSPYGAGWDVAGLSRLHVNKDGSALITDGDGAHTRFAALFQAPVNFPNFSDISALTLNGVAPGINSTPVVVDGQTVLRLTNNFWQLSGGSAFLTKRVTLGQGNNLSFSTQFSFQITNNQGLGDSDGPGADGFGFVIQGQGNTAVGTFGSGMTPSLAVEFDTFRNATGTDSDSGNHVGININGNLVSVAFKHIDTRLNNGNIWYVWIDYDNGSRLLEVRLAQTATRPGTPTLTHTVDLASILGQSSAFIGFAAGTGRAMGNHDIRSWAFASAGTKIGRSDQLITPAGDFTTLIKNTDGSFTRFFKDGSKVHFNAQGLQISVVDRNNNATTYAYDSTGRLLTVTDPVGQVTTLSYAGDTLASVTDPAGRSTSFAHDGDNNLTQVTLPDGSTRSFGYDNRHLMTSETDARNFTTTRQYDFSGRLVSATLANGSVRKTTNAQSIGLVNPASGVGTKANPAPFTRPTSVKSSFIDGENRSRVVDTDKFGAAEVTTDTAGLVTRITRDKGSEDGVLLGGTGFTAGQVGRAFTFDGINDQVKVAGQVGNFGTRDFSVSFWMRTTSSNPQALIGKRSSCNHGSFFDIRVRANGLVSAEVDQNSAATNYIAIATTKAANDGAFHHIVVVRKRETLSIYMDGVLQTSKTASGIASISNATNLSFGSGPCVGVGGGRTFRGDMDEVQIYALALNSGDVVSLFQAGNRGDSQALPGIEHHWPADGNTKDVIGADGLPTQISTPDGAVTTMAYDNRGNLLSSTDATLGGTTRFTYEPIFNQITSVTDARGKTSSLAYDAKGSPTVVTSPLGRKRTFAYNTRGQPLTYTNVFGTTTSLTYNAQGNAQSVTQGSGANARTFALAYTPAGLLKTLTDPLGRALNLTYDTQGRVTQQTLPDGRVIAFAYDAAGNLARITPPGRTAHVFAYDNVDQEKVYTPPALGANVVATTFQYNKERQLTKITRPDAQQVTFAYDSAGRLQTTQLPRGPIRFQYSATTGQLTNITAPGAIALGYGYNKQLVTSETLSGPISGTVSRAYDQDFRITGLAVNAQNIAYTYDDDGLLIQAGVLTLQRNTSTGFIDSTAQGSVSTTRGYNAFGEINQHGASAAGTNLYNVVYVRDKLGRISKKTETLAGDTVVFDYQYDVAGRMTTVTQNGVPITYTFDSNSNRLSQTSTSGTTTGIYDAQDRLLSYGNSTYTYNNNGDLLTRTQNGQTTQYTYDVMGNLTQATLPNATTIDYLIDGRNRRIAKKVNGVLVQGFLYQDQLNPVAELDGSGNIKARFVYGSRSNTPAYMIKNNQTYRIISDHLGSPRLVINTLTGNVEQRLDYDTFGNITRDTNPGFQPFGFAGGIYDSDTKLTRFGARDYDSITGRWTTKDPIRFSGGDTNLYGYVDANPLRYVDPTGEFGQVLGPVVVGIAILYTYTAIVASRNARVGAGLATPGLGLPNNNAPTGYGPGSTTETFLRGSGFPTFPNVNGIAGPAAAIIGGTGIAQKCEDNADGRCKKVKEQCIQGCSKIKGVNKRGR